MARQVDTMRRGSARVGMRGAHPGDNHGSVGRAGPAAGRGPRKVGLRTSLEASFDYLFRRLVNDSVARLGKGAEGRKLIARELGVSYRTLEKWLSPSEDRHPAFATVCALLSREDLLDPVVAGEVKRAIAREWGLVAGDLPGAASEDGLRAAALRAGAKVGDVAQAVEAATSDRGEGSRVVTPAERDTIVREAVEAQGALESVVVAAGGGR